jgi:hypothetical protein
MRFARLASRLGGETPIRYRRLASSRRHTLTWEDGTPAYVDDALEAFLEPLAALLARARPRSVVAIHPSPVWRSLEIATYRPRRSAHRDAADWSIRIVDRPSRAERVRHARATLARWRDLVATRDAGRYDREETRELLLRFAPVEFLADEKEGTHRAADVARDAIERLVRRSGCGDG